MLLAVQHRRPGLSAADNPGPTNRLRPSAVVCAHAHAQQTPSFAPGPSQPIKALREWSVINAAIGDGLQMVLLRKGGIDEAGFKIESRDLLLFPSYFHADASLLKPGIADRYKEEMALDPKAVPELQLSTFARVTGAWATLDPEVVSAVDDLHIGTAAFLENRIKWRRGQALTVLELQAWRLSKPVVVVPQPQHFGCFSWVDLGVQSQSLDLDNAQPCIPNFPQRQQQLRQRLAALKDNKELTI